MIESAKDEESEAMVGGNEAWSDDTNSELGSVWEDFAQMGFEVEIDEVGGLEPNNIPLNEEASFRLCDYLLWSLKSFALHHGEDVKE